MNPAVNSPTDSEAKNFFWNCLVAAKLIDELPVNTATKANVLHAVRKATVCATGRNGVQHASAGARAKREEIGKHWEQCGLVKEHVVPVNMIRALVDSELRSTRDSLQAATPLVRSQDETQGLTPEVIALFQDHPRAWRVARIVREWTHLAWITKDEEERFDDKTRHAGISIRKRMPKGWAAEHDLFARYSSCEIKVSRI